MPLSIIFQLYRGGQFNWWGKPEKAIDLRKSLTNSINNRYCIDNTLPWAGFELTILVLIGNDYRYTITTTTTHNIFVRYHIVSFLQILYFITIYYEFSLLHIFSLVLQPWMSAYIRKTDGVYISVPEND
jgi:hypothetical protein